MQTHPKRARLAVSALGLGVLIACGGGGGEAPGGPESEASAGARLYRASSCHTCHGDAGEGGTLGPPLSAGAGHWTVETLVAYLKDPKGYAARDARMSSRPKRYMMPMPAVKGRSDEELAELAAYALELAGR